MLATHSSTNRDNWAPLLPFIQLAFDYIILGIHNVGTTADTEDFTKGTRGNLHIALELARRNLSERAPKQAFSNAKLLPYPILKPGTHVLVYRPYQDFDGEEPHVVCSQL